MEELYDLGISEFTIKSMLELYPNIKEFTVEEIRKKIEYLKKLNCSKNQIINIISSNPFYLDRTNDEIILLINKLNDLHFNTLNILFDSNPFILNLEPFEIDNYLNNRMNNNEKIEEIIDDLESNPYLFFEM